MPKILRSLTKACSVDWLSLERIPPITTDLFCFENTSIKLTVGQSRINVPRRCLPFLPGSLRISFQAIPVNVTGRLSGLSALGAKAQADRVSAAQYSEGLHYSWCKQLSGF